MEAYLNELNGVANAILALRQSKRHIDRFKEMEIRNDILKRTTSDYITRGVTYETYTTSMPSFNTAHTECKGAIDINDDIMKGYMEPLLRFGRTHITLLKFIDLNFTVYGLHRAGQDDLDSHAKRMDNRIIRASTRLGRFEDGEMSDWYKGKILTTDQALAILGIKTPNELQVGDKVYVKSPNGYILKGMENQNDVRRGLYMLSIPSDFIFSINLAEFAHVYQERREGGAAHPELRQCVERMADQLEAATAGYITRTYLMGVKN